MNGSSASILFDQLPHGYRMDRRFGPVYDRTPSGADDLTLLRGVDTREAVILNRLGVYFLPQIALWEQHEACSFADELGMNASTLIEEQWVEQAQVLCRPGPSVASKSSNHLPASLIRTLSLLACALLVGCFVVYWLNLRANPPLRGVLSADITSLRVPTEARLTVSHVQAGDEVFSGDTLITLEKTEHLTMISAQERRVLELARQLQQAEAQAALDLAWRSRELERELSEVRTRAHLIQEVNRSSKEPLRAASLNGGISRGADPSVTISTVSRTRQLMDARQPARPNSMIFISGASGESSVDSHLSATSDHQSFEKPTAPQLVLASEPKAESILGVEAASVEVRLRRLEDLRDVLPEQVRQAAGVESIRVQYDEASQRLTEMKTLSREVAVVCPAYGKVGQIRYKAGDTMPAGEIMLKILHTDRRYVILNVPTRRVNEIQPGTEVDLIFPGEDHYRGKVSNLPMLADSTLPGGQSLVTVRVDPVGRLWPEIPVGSQIDVVVHGGLAN